MTNDDFENTNTNTDAQDDPAQLTDEQAHAIDLLDAWLAAVIPH